MATPIVPDPTPNIETKPWYTSKQFWLGVVMTILGIAIYFQDPAHTPALTLSSIALAVGGIAQVVLRVWFTNQPISMFSARRLRAGMIKRLGQKAI